MYYLYTLIVSTFEVKCCYRSYSISLLTTCNKLKIKHLSLNLFYSKANYPGIRYSTRILHNKKCVTNTYRKFYNINIFVSGDALCHAFKQAVRWFRTDNYKFHTVNVTTTLNNHSNFYMVYFYRNYPYI